MQAIVSHTVQVTHNNLLKCDNKNICMMYYVRNMMMDCQAMITMSQITDFWQQATYIPLLLTSGVTTSVATSILLRRVPLDHEDVWKSDW